MSDFQNWGTTWQYYFLALAEFSAPHAANFCHTGFSTILDFIKNTSFQRSQVLSSLLEVWQRQSSDQALQKLFVGFLICQNVHPFIANQNRGEATRQEVRSYFSNAVMYLPHLVPGLGTPILRKHKFDRCCKQKRVLHSNCLKLKNNSCLRSPIIWQELASCHVNLTDVAAILYFIKTT